MPTDDTLTADVAELRRLKDAASPLPWGSYILEGIVSEPLRQEHRAKVSHIPAGSSANAYAGLPNYNLFMLTSRWSEPEKGSADCAYLVAAANLAPKLAGEVDRLQREVEALARFKKWVHDYLDGKGIPHHPPGVHGAEGCRIGDRMDYLFAEVNRLREAMIPAGIPLTDDVRTHYLKMCGEVLSLREALQTLARWQVERRPGASGEMCDFADAALEGRDND